MEEISEEEKETDVRRRKGLTTWKRIKNELRIMILEDFLLLRVFTLFGMTFCFAMFLVQIGTSLRSYELLQRYIEEKDAQYSFWDYYESNEYWSWDPDLFLLTVNTTFYVH